MKPDGTPAQPTETWQITILYDQPEARQCAARACDNLVRRFWARVEFDTTWWALDELEGPEHSRAAQRLQETDIVVLAMANLQALHPGLLRWLEQTLQQRQGREGALIVLCAGQTAPLHRLQPELNARLHALARRVGLDYLNEPPTSLPGRLPHSLDSYTHRAEQNTDVIRRILDSPPPPPPPAWYP
ncbi:hypothetical protein [Limisphaera sp. 4302-co]|uniref:hypothetical protein n=1 Tax=Limisphaera sp. 4302-co TaxID=3400417 RepID=UPI003C287DE0